MGDHLQQRRSASIEKIAVPDKKAAFHFHTGAAPGQDGAAPNEAPAAAGSPRTAPHPHGLKHSPKACLCSPTTHAGSFRCRLHRGMLGVGGSIGSGLHEMCKKPGV